MHCFPNVTGWPRSVRIAKNLHRREISAMERDELIAAWARLRGKRLGDEVSGQGVHKPNGGRPLGGISQAARDLNLGRRTVERAIRVDGLAPGARIVARELGLDGNQKALLEAARVPSAEAQIDKLRQRAPSIAKAVAGEDAGAQVGIAPTPERNARLFAAWRDASDNDRRLFVSETPELREIFAELAQ
jgi:hypothetical protein